MFQELPWYCQSTIGDYMKAIPENTMRDGARLFKVMRKDYQKRDYDQQINSRNFLETPKAKPRTEKDHLKKYCRQFHTISHHFVERSQLEAYTRAMCFVQGLLPKVREKVVRKVGCDPDDAETMNYDKISRVASTIAYTEHILDDFTVSKAEMDDLSNIVDYYQSKVTLTPTVRYNTPVSKPAPNPAINDDGIKSMTKALENLTLTTQVMANRMGTMQGSG